VQKQLTLIKLLQVDILQKSMLAATFATSQNYQEAQLSQRNRATIRTQL